jgi:hypothetical protein
MSHVMGSPDLGRGFPGHQQKYWDGQPPGSAWAVAADSPKPPIATPPDSSVPTIMRFKVWVVFTARSFADSVVVAGN